MIELVLPDAGYQPSYIEALTEFRSEGRYTDLDLAALQADFGAYVQQLRHRQIQQPDGFVPSTTYWLVDSEALDYIGRINIRHELTPSLRNFGGHIGYDIRPMRRQRGYGTLMLRLALPKVRDLGINPALVTCDTTNIASQRIIQANGGILEDIIHNDFRDVPTMRWWIHL